MDFKNVVLALCIVICSMIHQGNCLQCYECNSATVPGCGTTWEVPRGNASYFLKKCEGEGASCRKMVSSDTLNGMTIVKRSCHHIGSNTSVGNDFFTCNALAKQGEACYCRKDACNGRQPLLACWELLSALVILVCLTQLRH